MIQYVRVDDLDTGTRLSVPQADLDDAPARGNYRATVGDDGEAAAALNENGDPLPPEYDAFQPERAEEAAPSEDGQVVDQAGEPVTVPEQAPAPVEAPAPTAAAAPQKKAAKAPQQAAAPAVDAG